MKMRLLVLAILWSSTTLFAQDYFPKNDGVKTTNNNYTAFTNEAQVNALLPNFRYPVVAGHEVGHQLGYSAENETNFIGYLVTSSNSDIYFKYSAYSYALAYCLSDIRKRDEPTFERLFKTINGGVKKNYNEISEFWLTYKNPTEPVFKSIFDTFLKANNQSKGIDSYNAVVSLLINYHEEHPL